MALLLQHATSQYDQFTGRTMERYFQEKAMQSGKFTQVGNWWDRKSECEIDLLAINEFDKTAVVADIKRNGKKINMNTLDRKAEQLMKVGFNDYKIQTKPLSLNDM